MKARLPQGYQNSAPNMNQMVRKAQEDAGGHRQDPGRPCCQGVHKAGRRRSDRAGDDRRQAAQVRYYQAGGRDPEDIEMLQDLIISGVNEILKEVDDYGAAEMEKVTGGVSFPGFI